MLEEQHHRCTLRATRGQSKEERGCSEHRLSDALDRDANE
jgi:hypothetical protein